MRLVILRGKSTMELEWHHLCEVDLLPDYLRPNTEWIKSTTREVALVDVQEREVPEKRV